MPGISGRICSYWQPNFPAVSVVTCRDFRALPLLAPEGRDFPAVSVISGQEFPAVAFLAWVLKKTLCAAGKLFWYLQRDFLSLIREFFGEKLKQKGFFHSVGYITRDKNVYFFQSWAFGKFIFTLQCRLFTDLYYLLDLRTQSFCDLRTSYFHKT